jgi:outer membrane receptor protein involved in Fe transport
MGDNSMTYANISQGYRSGGAINQVVPEMPDSFDHDETMNYEIGAKTAWFDNRLTVNAALYKIDFIDMQYRAPFQNDAFDAQLNCDGTCAESLGYELEISIAATDSLSFYINYGHTENEVLFNLYRPYEDETLGYASLEGDPLSVQTPIDTASAGVQFVWEAANVDWFARLDYSYTGGLKRVNNDRQCCEPFVQGQPITDASDPRFEGHGIPGIPDNEYAGDIPLATLEQDIPTASWQALHARVGFRGETWGVDLFARNITDELAAIHQANNGVFLADRTLAQPRTIGVQFRWSYY